MLELILSKKSSESEIKSYFNAVLELSKSDNEFPINLDEVWMLVYGRKEEAVRALTSSEQFIENIDYQVLRKKCGIAFKKILFSFGSMESLRNFVPFTDDDCIRYVKQAVKLLISYMGFFMPLLDIGGCLYVRL